MPHDGESLVPNISYQTTKCSYQACVNKLCLKILHNIQKYIGHYLPAFNMNKDNAKNNYSIVNFTLICVVG